MIIIVRLRYYKYKNNIISFIPIPFTITDILIYYQKSLYTQAKLEQIMVNMIITKQLKFIYAQVLRSNTLLFILLLRKLEINMVIVGKNNIKEG